MIFWFFGKPGSGKDFCAELLARARGIPHIDADTLLLPADRDALLSGTFTPAMRHAKIRRVAAEAHRLLGGAPHVTVADSLPDHASRQLVRAVFPGNVLLIHVVVGEEERRRRLRERTGHFFAEEVAEGWVRTNWEPVAVPHVTLDNNRPPDAVLADLLALFDEATRSPS